MKNLLILIFFTIKALNCNAQDKISTKDNYVMGYYKDGKGYNSNGTSYSPNIMCWVENGKIYDSKGTPSNSTNWKIVGYYENGKVYDRKGTPSNSTSWKIVGSYGNGKFYYSNGKLAMYYEGGERSAAVAAYASFVLFYDYLDEDD